MPGNKVSARMHEIDEKRICEYIVKTRNRLGEAPSKEVTGCGKL